MNDFGKMDVTDRGGAHEYEYEHSHGVPPSDGLTPSQTIGPFFAYGLTPGSYGYPLEDIHSNDLAPPSVQGNRISVDGHVFDGDGAPVHDALVEIIHADGEGRYATSERNDGFTGYGRCGTGAHGTAGDTSFSFATIKPGRTMNDHAPFITVIVTMRGLLNHCITRIYFPEDNLTTDPVMLQVPEPRRKSLIAVKGADNTYRFDIHMQGARETVFFDL